MIRSVQRLVVGAVIVCANACHAYALPTSPLRLVHLAHNTRPLEVPAATRQWLVQRQNAIRVGVVPNTAAPFDIVDATGSYTGITAELLDRLRSSADLRLTIHTFPDQHSMLEAAARGDIDLATTVAQRAPDVPSLLYSLAYFPDQDSIVERNGNNGFAPVESASPSRLAYVPSLVSASVLTRQFPTAKLHPVKSPAIGLTAVAFGQADQYIGNANISNYLIERLQLLNLSIRRFTTYRDSAGFQFAAPSSHAPLIELVNRLVSQITIEDLAETRSRWEGRPDHVDLDLATVLSPVEKAWIHAHPIVYFQVERDRPPYLFHDDKNGMAGVTADMMDLITTQTGIRFRPANDHLPHDAVVVLPVMSAGAATSGFIASSPYSWSGFGIVTRAATRAASDASAITNQRIAIPNDGTGDAVPLGASTTARRLFTRTVRDALSAVDDGTVDAAIVNINMANYYIAQRYPGKLVVSGYLEPGTTAQIGFGIPNTAPELATIIDKVLQGTREARLNDIRNRWNYTGIPDAEFQPWRRRLWVGMAIALAFGLLLLGWNRSLARQIKLRKKAEATLKQAFQLQQTLLNSMPFPFFICDFQLKLQGWNRAFEAAIGAEQCTVGLDLRTLDAADDSIFTQLSDALCAAARTHQSQFTDTRARVGDRKLDTHAWVVPFVSDASDQRSLLSGWMDVSERGEMQRAAKRAKDEAESANLAKSTFLATISHEIRTPMNAILGILELRVADAERQGGERPEDLDAALESARALIAMLDEILDLSKIEAGKLTIAKQPVYLTQITDSVAAIYQEVAGKKGLSFHYIATSDIGQIVTDGARLRQILSNLLSNAIKFTEQGNVSLNVHVDAPAMSDTTIVHIEVTDTGMGIEAAAIPTLLEPYTQASPEIAAQYGGTGLGLPICNQLTTALGGKLSIDSQIAQGTRMTLDFVFPRVSGTAQRGSPARSIEDECTDSELFRGRTALIVDDHAPNRIVLSRQMQRLGFLTVDCGLASEALALLDQTHVDVILTDFNMPGMNGFQLVREIRQREAVNALAPRRVIIGCTANLSPDALKHTSDDELDAYLTKPLPLRELANALRPIFAKKRKASHPSHHETPRKLSGKPTQQSETTESQSISILDQAVGVDPASEAEMLRELITTCEADIAQLQAALAANDIRAIGDVVHRIHSTANVCHLPVLAQLTEKAEASIRLGPSSDHAEFVATSRAIVDITQRLVAKLRTQLAQRRQPPEHD
ncbi:ATP-binding protein [Burkholderia ubonensis]|uniref:ATP-binding protein n=1 Tax=Burkholderia ubonensis TaxID=101571 RepID=UPI0018E05DE7|nr:transporter substrate-binding domain-containing protein [Burkholderia ubonensis]